MLELFFTFFRIGLFTFGGGYAMIPLLRQEVVAHGWMDGETLIRYIAICESTPGPIAVNMATFIGSSQYGLAGAAVATLGVVLPSFAVILAIAAALKQFRSNRYVDAALSGVHPAVAGMILATGVCVALECMWPKAGFDVRILFLTASDQELVKRFSETRRRHPLSTLAASRDQLVTLQEAISRERDLLAPISAGAALMDTTGILSSQLREWVKKFVGQPQAMMTLTFESFAFKHGLPVASDLVFDVRCLPNPYYDPALRPLTGRDKPVADYLRTFPTVINMVDDIEGFIRKWLPAYIAQNRHYLTVAVGWADSTAPSSWPKSSAPASGTRTASSCDTASSSRRPCCRARSPSRTKAADSEDQKSRGRKSRSSLQIVSSFTTGVGIPTDAVSFSPRSSKPSGANPCARSTATE